MFIANLIEMKAYNVIGRKLQIEQLKDAVNTSKAEFIAVTGRRRIGKTFLIKQVYQQQICFEITGIQNGSQKEQLNNFSRKLSDFTKSPIPFNEPPDWFEAFYQLKKYIESIKSKSKVVIFIDELPWLATRKSKFLQALAHFWNDFLSTQNAILVVCGSATSWITKKVINDKGELHNRITQTIILQTFTLKETKQFFESKNIHLEPIEVVKIYMALGGIPYYLEQIKKGESASQVIDRLCFQEEGALKNEYDNLYKALFYNAQQHESIIEALAKKKIGLTREELVLKSKLPDGGSFTRVLKELIVTGFVKEIPTFDKKKRGALYRLIDNFSLFYLAFMESNKRYSDGLWMQLSQSQAYKIWSGYAFENICLGHVSQIKQSLGFSAVYTTTSGLLIKAENKNNGIQIDLILDRKDNVIHLFEIKFYDSKFKITKAYANKLRERKRIFREHTSTRKQLFTTFITSFGIVENQYSLSLVDSEVKLIDLFG